MTTTTTPTTNLDRYPELAAMLQQVGQAHVLKYWDLLSDCQRATLVQQIDNIDWTQVTRQLDSVDHKDHWHSLSIAARPPEAILLADFFQAENHAIAWQRGAAALEQHQVAFVLTAGGQGTRLGFDHPKGMYPIGPLSQRSLFQIMLEHCQARAKQFHTTIPIYIMTSPQTHDETREYMDRNGWFGLPRSDIQLFCQGEMPAIDQKTGAVLMAEPGFIATSPDGHGGAIRALDRHGCLADMQRRGVEYIFYGQIDNPLLQVCDPAFLGYHLLHRAEMTSQVIRKSDPLQRVGNVVQVDGRARIIEYSDLTESAAQQRNPDGSLHLWAGSIAVHVFNRDFLKRAVDQPEWLPFHRALKKVPTIDSAGQPLIPTHNNAIKLERFIFDLMPHATQALACEIDPAHGFAALKNAPPAATETATWVQRALADHFATWIGAIGGTVAPGAIVEINPLFAVDIAELRKRLKPGVHVAESTYFV